ncbi:MAG: TolC family protein [Deltaproteobacteria bacterium]|nr:TolC family protein [Deltaproteobacteria bacterium]MBW2101711.1 TolC family protein [Deltaproteobacteria bacterium]
MRVEIRLLLLSLLFFLVFTGSARSAPPTDTADPFHREASLQTLIAYAARENPRIRAARQAWKAALENFRVVTGYPDPMLMATYFPDPIETRLGPQDWTMTLSQKIPFPGKLAGEGRVVEADVRVARLELDKTIREVVRSVKESFHELRYIREAKRVARENLELLNHLRKVGESAFAARRTTLLDVIKAQEQVGQLHYDLVLLDDLEQTETTRLNTLLNRPPGAPIGRLGDVSGGSLCYTLEELYRIAEENQEDIQMARAEINRAEAKLHLARLETMPDFNVGLFYSGIGKPDVPVQPPDAGRDAVGVRVGLTVPLWFGKNRGRVERALAERESARARKEAQVNRYREKIRSTYFKLKNAARLMDLYRNELLPQAAGAMEIAETWFREKESSFSDFVEAQSLWYHFRLALERATADYGKNLAALEQMAGRELVHRPQEKER